MTTVKQHVILLVDISSSMFHRAPRLVSGINNFINSLRQRDDSQDLYISLLLFNDKITHVCGAVPVQDIQTFLTHDIVPFGMTHLYDAIGLTIQNHLGSTSAVHHNLFIISDGYDTGSNLFTRDQASQLCDNASQNGWNITHCDVNISNLDSNSIKKVVYDADNIDQLFSSLAI
jgi:uncharacterized protein YegL